MARRMIPVRNIETGVTALVSERAFPLFSGTHERLDVPPASEATSEPAANESAAPAAASAKPSRRAAATDKE